MRLLSGGSPQIAKADGDAGDGDELPAEGEAEEPVEALRLSAPSRGSTMQGERMYLDGDCFVCGGVPRVLVRSKLDEALYAYCWDCGGPYVAPDFGDIPRAAEIGRRWESRFEDA